MKNKSELFVFYRSDTNAWMSLRCTPSRRRTLLPVYFFSRTLFNALTCMISRPQTSDQRADGPAEPRPFAAVQHQASTHPRPDHTAPANALFAHIARFRQSRDRGRAHSHTGERTS